MANLNDPNQSNLDRALDGTTMGGGRTFDPIVENNYWSENWSSRPYASADLGFEHYQPAYQHGWESRMRYQGHRWEDVEGNVMREWEAAREKHGHEGTWEHMKHAVKDAWDRVTG